ncbi:MAG: fatty acid cis/trans isomerase [Pseudomonadales bacterium]
MTSSKIIKRFIAPLLSVVFLVGCTVVATHYLDTDYGTPEVVDRIVATPSLNELEYHHDIKPIIDRRCVVCHGCYDAPCQLKMSSFEAIDRGASKEKVYNGSRLVSANLTRLSIDAKNTTQWRAKGFYPVLNERIQTPEANKHAGVMSRMLQLKQNHPLPEQDVLPDSFDFKLDRKQQCSKIEDFDKFEKKYPLWGMPYGLPAVGKQEQDTLQQWLAAGAKASYSQLATNKHQQAVEQWENFLNGDSLKQKLMSRYIYEHLFLANIYFEGTETTTGERREFFKLVRSSTPSGEDIDIIPTRRPFDDPGDQLHYRLQKVQTTVLVKQHLPYRLNPQRMQRWQALFLDIEYDVAELPSYEPAVAANPFISFKDLPVNSRYKFMLDEAQFTIMGFIKGPVCRGQIALSVINDHFWVVFVDPDAPSQNLSDKFLAEQSEHLRLPAENESPSILPISNWREYSKLQQSYVEAKEAFFREHLRGKDSLDLSILWDGNGQNRNAALTIFRHYDSATVMQGMLGDIPKTAWIVNYSLLERIHYLLVAGFDVYGNVGHQLITRMYMDFLRMEGEVNFLELLPNATASKELAHWYIGAEKNVDLYLNEENSRDFESSGIQFETDDPKAELLGMIQTKFGEQVIATDEINHRPALAVSDSYKRQLQQLSTVTGLSLEHLPEHSLITLQLNNGETRLVSLVRNRAHTNVSSLFGESKRLIPAEQTLTVLEDVVGSYPNVFYKLDEEELTEFVATIAALKSEQDYKNLLNQYAVRRSSKDFWAHSDSVHDYYYQNRPIEAGLLDYNRLENR